MSLDPISYRQAEIERAAGVTITLNKIDDPWLEGAPTYWHGYLNEENPFRPGSRTTHSATGDGAFEVLDRLASELGVAIVYDIEPYVRAQIYGPSEDCYPAEGGCVTYLEANVELTAEERAEVVQWIEQNHDHEEDRDPDAAYTRGACRDHRCTRREQRSGALCQCV